jgi:hypothetical protein
MSPRARGAWIETIENRIGDRIAFESPRARGAWIETREPIWRSAFPGAWIETHEYR